jgi:hypothetical protein
MAALWKGAYRPRREWLKNLTGGTLAARVKAPRGSGCIQPLQSPPCGDFFQRFSLSVSSHLRLAQAGVSGEIIMW